MGSSAGVFCTTLLLCSSWASLASAVAPAPAPSDTTSVPAPSGTTPAPIPSNSGTTPKAAPSVTPSATPPATPGAPPPTHKAKTPAPAASSPEAAPAPAPSWHYVPGNQTVSWNSTGNSFTPQMVTLRAGDTLTVILPTGIVQHVYTLPNEAAYDSCDFSNATLLASSATGSLPQLVKTFEDPGHFFFSSNDTLPMNTTTLCQAGMKLHLDVEPAPTQPPTPAPPSKDAVARAPAALLSAALGSLGLILAVM